MAELNVIQRNRLRRLVHEGEELINHTESHVASYALADWLHGHGVYVKIPSRPFVPLGQEQPYQSLLETVVDVVRAHPTASTKNVAAYIESILRECVAIAEAPQPRPAKFPDLDKGFE